MIIRWRELIGAVAMLALVVFGFYQTALIDLSFSSELESFSGPRAYPRIILAVMLGLTVLLIVRSAVLGRRLAPRAMTAKHPRFTRVAAAIGLIVLATFLFDPVGYLLVIPPLIFATGWLNGARNHVANALTAVAVSAGCLLLFRYGVNIVLPEGLLGIDQIF